MSTSVRFLKAEAGVQTAFESVATPDFIFPAQGRYSNAGVWDDQMLDDGRWVGAHQITKISDFATIEFEGPGWFEMLPVMLNAGINEVNATGAGPYDYDYTLSLTTPGTPIPYTFLLGGNEDIGGTGPAVRIQDAYCEQFRWRGNDSNQLVTCNSRWFGAGVNDNSGAGFAFQGADMPTPLAKVRYPYNTLEYEAATTTGGVFTTMTAFDCVLINWELTVNTGLVPKRASDANALTYCGIIQNAPEVLFRARLRTDSATYAAIAANANADLPVAQEVQFTNTGASSRLVVWQMTGYWQPVRNVHDRAGDEVTMDATFMASGYSAQTTTPHAFGYEIATQWEHNA